MSESAVKEKIEILSIGRVFDAPINQVFQAWTEPNIVSQWFGPDEVKVTNISFDFQIGGKFEIEMQLPEGTKVIHHGVFKEIEQDKKLVYTWLLDGQECDGCEGQYAETIVTVNFREVGNKTEITLTHAGLPTKEAFEAHEFGWTGSLQCLSSIL